VTLREERKNIYTPLPIHRHCIPLKRGINPA